MTTHFGTRRDTIAKRILPGLVALFGALAATAPTSGYSPLAGDLATLEGVRGNAILGYGLVVGLQGTGDKQQTLFTNQSLRNFLERQGISLPAGAMKVANVAGVVVTATLSPFARPGSMLDVQVSSIGDSKSLRGGVLLLTPLNGADGATYATAQGPLAVGGAFVQSADGLSSAQLNHPTVATIPGGAVVERAAPTVLPPGQPLSYVLHRADFTTARRLAAAITAALGPGSAHAVDSRRVIVEATTRPGVDAVEVAATIERLRVVIDSEPRVVVNERTGTVVAGANIPLRPASIVHGGLTIDVRTEFEIAQPQPLSRGTTTVVPQTEVRLDERPASGLTLVEGSTVADLLRGLTDLGAGVSDIISVLQLLRDAGALDAEIEVR